MAFFLLNWFNINLKINLIIPICIFKKFWQLKKNYITSNLYFAWIVITQWEEFCLDSKKLTPGPSFGHNLCVKCPNGSCEPILDIYISRSFQWYNEFHNPIDFDPCNYSLKIRESIGTLTPKVGIHLGVWRFIPSHSPTFPRAWDVTLRLSSWPTPLQALALVASPKLGLQHPCLVIKVHLLLWIHLLTH